MREGRCYTAAVNGPPPQVQQLVSQNRETLSSSRPVISTTSMENIPGDDAQSDWKTTLTAARLGYATIPSIANSQSEKTSAYGQVGGSNKTPMQRSIACRGMSKLVTIDLILNYDQGTKTISEQASHSPNFNTNVMTSTN
ncbi:hypothetical protein TNCV_106071 [Trichonephila clavipes]|nr:hypothetical protein TNCV_106071 [Trichonephila clavipes]